MPSNVPRVGQLHKCLKTWVVAKILSKWAWLLQSSWREDLYDLILAVPSSIFSTTVSSTFFSYLHSSLSQVVPHVVHLVQSLRSDGLPNSKTFLLQFTELIHCMMYQYSGFPDLYDNILEAIKVKSPHSCLRKYWSPVISQDHCENNQDLLTLPLLLKSHSFNFVILGSTETRRREDQVGVESKCLDIPVQLIRLGLSEANWKVWDGKDWAGQPG